MRRFLSLVGFMVSLSSVRGFVLKLRPTSTASRKSEVLRRRQQNRLHALQQHNSQPRDRQRIYTTSRNKRLANSKRFPSTSYNNKLPKSIQAPDLFQAFDPALDLSHADELRRPALARIANSRILTAILNSWAKSRAWDAPERCYGVLQYLRGNGEEMPWLGPPSEFLYSVVITAYGRRQQADRAEAVLREMMLSQTGLEPNVIVFGSVMNAWGKATDVPDAPDQCRNLLTEMLQLGIEPNTYVYNVLIDAYASHGRANEAQKLLEEMLEEEQECGKIPIPRPDKVTFNCALNAWTKSNAEDAPDRCRELLQIMIGETDIEPDMQTYTTLIGAYSNRGRAREAEQVLRDMTVKADVVAYSSVINAWSKSDDLEGPDHCLRLLEEMKELSSAADGSGHLMHKLTPNLITYATVMDAYASRGRPDEAERLLKQVLDSPQLTPNILCYNMVLKAWGKSDATDAPDRCKHWLDLLSVGDTEGNGNHNNDLQPTLISYNTVLEAYAVRGRAQEAQALLREMLAKSGHGISPNRISFHSVMFAWFKSNDPTAPDKCLELLKEMQRLRHAAPTVKTLSKVVNTFKHYGRTGEAAALSREWGQKREKKGGWQGRRELRP